jgi:hypothetical protein
MTLSKNNSSANQKKKNSKNKEPFKILLKR